MSGGAPKRPTRVFLPEAGAVPAPPHARDIEELKRGFEAWLERRGKAATTRRLYLRNAAEFLDWLASSPPLAGEKPDAIVARYFKHLEEIKPGNSGNLRRSTAARSFLTFAGTPPQAFRREDGPYTGLRKGQGARYLDLEDSAAVLAAVRERAIPQEVGIVGLLLLSEMSPRLVCSLLVGDLAGLDQNGQRWRVVRGKQSWEFTVPRSIAAVLLQLPRAQLGPRSPLFVDPEGKALTRQSLDDIMKDIGAEAEIPDLAAYRLTMSRSKRSGQGVGWDALPSRQGKKS